MATPSQNLQGLIEAYRQGQIDKEAFLTHLAHFETFVNGFREHIENMNIPEELSEGEAFKVAAASCFENYYEAIDLLRAFAENGNAELLESVMKLSLEADSGLATLGQESHEQAQSMISVDSLGD